MHDLDRTAFPENARALLVGHFSTVGDVEVLRQVERRMAALGLPYDVSPYTDGRLRVDPTWVNSRTLDPARYTHVVVICGPFTRDLTVRHDYIFARFKHCIHIGVNLTMVQDVALFNPFEVLLERDSTRTVRADLSFREAPDRVPVVGLCLAGSQREYGSLRRGPIANEKLRRLVRGAGVAFVEMDTALPAESNRFGLSSVEQFESICGRLDAMLTTRLHGMVLSLKNGVPVVAIDPVAGGAKVSQQARLLGWSEVFDADEASDAALAAALQRCLAPEGREKALACAAFARTSLQDFDDAFTAALSAAAQPALRTGFVMHPDRLRAFRAKLRAWKRKIIPSRRRQR